MFAACCAALEIPTRIIANIQPMNNNTSTGAPNAPQFWTEIFSSRDKRWMHVDCVRKIIDEPSVTTFPILQPGVAATLELPLYILSFHRGTHGVRIKDVTKRYSPSWVQSLRQREIPGDWLEYTLESINSKSNPTKHLQEMEAQEDKEFASMKAPFPTRKSDYRNHPLYVIEEFLKKYEVVYPKDLTSIAGHFKEHVVYHAKYLQTLHTEEKWIQQGRQIKSGEKPFKELPKKGDPDTMSNFYGIWQTKVFKPPVAKNGKVPKNKFGNVYLFKQSMLPVNTTVLNLEGVDKICRQLGLDYAKAMIEWGRHGGHCHPVWGGTVVCSEHVDTITAAWNQSMEQKIQKQKELDLKKKQKEAKLESIKRQLSEKFNTTSGSNNTTPTKAGLVDLTLGEVIQLDTVQQEINKDNNHTESEQTEHIHQFAYKKEKTGKWTKYCKGCKFKLSGVEKI